MNFRGVNKGSRLLPPLESAPVINHTNITTLNDGVDPMGFGAADILFDRAKIKSNNFYYLNNFHRRSYKRRCLTYSGITCRRNSQRLIANADGPARPCAEANGCAARVRRSTTGRADLSHQDRRETSSRRRRDFSILGYHCARHPTIATQAIAAKTEPARQTHAIRAGDATPRRVRDDVVGDS